MNLPPNHTLIQHDAIDSTNLEARRIIEAGQIGEGVLVISAKSQTAGKGRLGRCWVSNEGNLFVSVVKKIPKSQLGILSNNNSLATTQNFPSPLFPFLAAIAIGETLQGFMNKKPLYKWPNDVLVEGKKISGVLIEIINDYVIIGIGINIGTYPKEAIKLPATCLNEYAKTQINIDDVLGLLIHKLHQTMALDNANILKEWTESAYGIGKKILVGQGGQEISGVFTGIDVNGRLILETQTGISELVSFGDVSWI